MAPQLKDGYTRIVNELLEALISHELRASEIQIVLFIIRVTYGWNKTSSEVPQNAICNCTGVSSRQVSRALKDLKSKRVIRVVKEATFRSPAQYGVEKDWTKWKAPRTGTKPGKEWLRHDTEVMSGHESQEWTSLTGHDKSGEQSSESASKLSHQADLSCETCHACLDLTSVSGGTCHACQEGHDTRVTSPPPSKLYEKGIVRAPKDMIKDMIKDIEIPPTPQDQSEDTLRRGVAILEQLAPGGLTSYRKKLFEFLELPDADDQKLAALETAARDVHQALRSPRHQIHSPALMAIHQARTELVRLRDVATSSADYEDDGPPEATEEQLRW